MKVSAEQRKIKELGANFLVHAQFLVFTAFEILSYVQISNILNVIRS